jgi:hypothetical protein
MTAQRSTPDSFTAKFFLPVVLQDLRIFDKIQLEMLSCQYDFSKPYCAPGVKSGQKDCQDCKQLLRHACNPHSKRAATTAYV